MAAVILKHAEVLKHSIACKNKWLLTNAPVAGFATSEDWKKLNRATRELVQTLQNDVKAALMPQTQNIRKWPVMFLLKLISSDINIAVVSSLQVGTMNGVNSFRLVLTEDQRKDVYAMIARVLLFEFPQHESELLSLLLEQDTRNSFVVCDSSLKAYSVTYRCHHDETLQALTAMA